MSINEDGLCTVCGGACYGDDGPDESCWACDFNEAQQARVDREARLMRSARVWKALAKKHRRGHALLATLFHALDVDALDDDSPVWHNKAVHAVWLELQRWGESEEGKR